MHTSLCCLSPLCVTFSLPHLSNIVLFCFVFLRKSCNHHIILKKNFVSKPLGENTAVAACEKSLAYWRGGPGRKQWILRNAPAIRGEHIAFPLGSIFLNSLKQKVSQHVIHSSSVCSCLGLTADGGRKRPPDLIRPCQGKARQCLSMQPTLIYIILLIELD